MIKFIKKYINYWYYRKLFFRIYFSYLKYSDNPENAINDAFEDLRAIKAFLNSRLRE